MGRRLGFGIWFAAIGGGICACAAECEDSEDGLPTAAIECAADELCYRGRCLASCNAGQEGFIICERDAECTPPRGVCSDGFCSACAVGQTCVPGLDLCQEVRTLERPSPPERPEDGSQVPPGPLDGGLPDGGVQRFPPPNEERPVDAEVTRLLQARYDVVDVGGARSNQISVEAWDVRGTGPGREWLLLPDGPRLVSVALDAEGIELRTSQCEVQLLTTTTVALTRTNLGSMTFEEGDPGGFEAILTGYEARFTGGAYQVQPSSLPEQPFIPSTPRSADQGRLLFTGDGLAGVTAGGFSNQHHVPFELVPTTSTAINLERGWLVVAANPRPIVVGWRDPILGITVGESVFLEVVDANGRARILCEDREGPNGSGVIRVPEPLVEAFAARVGPGPHPLSFGRKNELVLPVPPGPGELIDATSRGAIVYPSVLRVRPTSGG